MTSPDITRKGIINQGGFFSPYYLFDLLSRQHADELDPEGREANRRLLRKPFRAALAKYGESGSTAGQAWTAWQRELFEALGFLGRSDSADIPLRVLDSPVETARHGLVPVARAAYPPAPAEPDDAETEPPPLVLVDLHGFGTDLDRATYPPATGPHKNDLTEEPVARAIEFALDAGPTRWAIVAAGDKLRLYRKGGSVARQYLEVNFPALFDADRTDEWTAFWGLFRYEAFVPDPAGGKCLLDRVLEASQRHAARIADDLRENIVLAVEALIQGALDDPANKTLLAPVRRDPRRLNQLFEESLYFLYRLLFVLYAESRDLLPVGESLVYRDTYSVEHLREMAERPLHAEDADKTYYIETLRTLFKMLHDGFPAVNIEAGDDPATAVRRANPPFTITPYNGQLFNPQQTRLLNRCRIPDRAMRAVIRELSLSRPHRRSDRRERYSYADLGVDQLGSIYEGLLVYEPAIVTEETVVAKVKGDERLVSRAQAEEYDLPVIDGSQRHPGSFVLRLWGGRRKGSGSYYTPQEITSFLVKEALEPLVEPIVQGCANPPSPGGRGGATPDDLLEIKVCDPAMGSGAFLIQACRYLAEAYGRAMIAAGRDDDGRMSQAEFARYKRRVAEKCLYGVDLNPLAVELAKVSLWLETLSRDRPLTFLDAHLRCGNSLIGAPLRNSDGAFTVKRLSAIPDEALKEVSKEAGKAQKEAARARIKRNRDEQKLYGGQQAGQSMLPGADWGLLSLHDIETTLTATLARRLELEASDEDLPPARAVQLVHNKEALFDHLQHADDSPYQRAKQIGDLWCAVWFWPEPGSAVTLEQNEAVTTVTAPEPPTTQLYLELVGGILGTDPGSLPPDERAAYLTTAAAVAAEQRFFHWELEFPELWREKNGRVRKNGGFDAVVGNPPWETVKPNSQEFWSNYDPLFRELNKQKALQFMGQSRINAEINREWLEYERNLVSASQFLKKSGTYLNHGGGDTNTYKLFLELSYQLLRVYGGFGLVLPSGLYTDAGANELRRLLFNRSKIQNFLAFTNERFIFPAVHHSFRFLLLTARKGEPTTLLKTLFRLNIQNAVSPEEISSLLASLDKAALHIPIETIHQFSPGTMSLMEFKEQREIDISSRIYGSNPRLGKTLDTTWNVNFDSGIHTTNDSDLFAANGLPVLEGKCIHQFNPTWQPPSRFIPENSIINQFERKKLAHLVLKGLEDRGFLRFRAIARSTDERTCISAICPPATIYEGNAPAIFVSDKSDDFVATYQLYLCALLNTLSIDFLLRLKVSAKINISTLEQLPAPRLTTHSPRFDGLVIRSVRLTSTTPEFADLWNEVAQQYPAELPTPWQPQHAATDPAERAQLRAEIDALVADLYGLSEEDFAYILTTFPLLDRDMPPLPDEPKSFITRDLALLALFKLRGKSPPANIVDFFAAAGADISAITGPLRDLAQRVEAATQLGAVAYIPSGRGGDILADAEDGDFQLDMFGEEE